MMLLLLFRFIFSSQLSDWNFAGLEKSPYYEATYKSYDYRFNFRKSLPTDSLCSISNCVLFELSTFLCDCYGILNTENITIFPDDTGVNFTYSYGVTYGHFSIKCADKLTYSVSYSGYDTYVIINAPQGCKGYGMNKKSGKGKLTWGFAVFLIVVISLFLYFAAGIPLEYYVFHKRGIEVLPFILYIGSFFGLVGHGAKFLFMWILGFIREKSGSSGGYNQL